MTKLVTTLVLIMSLSWALTAQAQRHRDRTPGAGTTSVEVGGTTIEGDELTIGGDDLDILGSADFSSELTFNARRPASLWLNQSGNVVNCARIVGIGGGNERGNFLLGIPAGRQKDCDIWLAVNEAQENGHVGLSYAFMCEIKHIGNVWGLDRCNELTRAATGELEQLVLGGIYDQAAQYMAEVSDEEFELVQEQAEMVQYRVEQQANLIESLEDEHAADQQEIEALRAALAEQQRAQEQEKEVKRGVSNQLLEILARIEAKEAAAAEEAADE